MGFPEQSCLAPAELAMEFVASQKGRPGPK
jgi:hypothetical protein